MKNIIVVVMLCGLLAPYARAQQDIPVSVAVMPFESFSGDQKAALGRDAAVKILQKLAENPLIITPDVQSLKEVMNREDAAAGSEERLREIARQLQVNFLIYGSVTEIKDAVSIDAQVFYNFPGNNYFKTFAEGPDLDNAAGNLAAKLEQELADKAAAVPAAQRPKVKRRRAPAAADTDAAEYEKTINRELAAEQDQDEQRQSVRSETEPEDLDEEAPAIEKPAKHKKREAGAARASDSLPLKIEEPININADTLEYSNKDNSAIFKGNVVARQGNISMFAEQMLATYAGKVGEQKKGGIKELIATGNVKIIQGERIATGQKIVFYGDEQKIVATGNPRVWQGDNVIVGNKITVYLKTDRSVVEGTTQDRVSATIYPKEKKSKSK